MVGRQLGQSRWSFEDDRLQCRLTALLLLVARLIFLSLLLGAHCHVLDRFGPSAACIVYSVCLISFVRAAVASCGSPNSSACRPLEQRSACLVPHVLHVLSRRFVLCVHPLAFHAPLHPRWWRMTWGMLQPAFGGGIGRVMYQGGMGHRSGGAGGGVGGRGADCGLVVGKADTLWQVHGPHGKASATVAIAGTYEGVIVWGFYGGGCCWAAIDRWRLGG